MDCFLKLVGGTPSALSNITRLRNDSDLKNLAKTYKLSPMELDQEHGLLEQSIVNRIATKYVVN